MKPTEAIDLVEQAFGYPLRRSPALIEELEERFSDVEPEEVPAEAVLVLRKNVIWELDGPAELRRLADPSSVQPSSILAFQLIGHFALKPSPFFTTTQPEYLRVDLAAPAPQPVMISGGRFEPYVGPVFSDLEAATRARRSLSGLRQLQIVDTPEDDVSRRSAASNLVKQFPELADLFWEKLVTLGADDAQRPRLADPPANVLFETALSLADCVLGRAPGATIDPALYELDPDHSGVRLVQMLAWYATEPDEGLSRAREVLAANAAPPLTRRWALRLIEGEAVAKRLRCR